jgi:hypothetical protein
MARPKRFGKARMIRLYKEDDVIIEQISGERKESEVIRELVHKQL